MRLSDFPVLADQNVREAVVEYLRGLLFDVVSAREGSLPGSTDEDLYELAVQQGRVIVTHDRDFGRLAVFEAVHPPGIVYVRPATWIPVSRFGNSKDCFRLTSN